MRTVWYQNSHRRKPAAPQPASALTDLRLFAGPIFRATTATQFLSHAIDFGGQLLMPLYFLKLRGAPPV